MTSLSAKQSKPSKLLLVIDEDPAVISLFKKLFEPELTVLTAINAEQGYSVLLQEFVGVLICNENLAGESGLQFMSRIVNEFKHLQPVLMSEGIDEDLLYFAVNEVGVLKYIKKPLHEDDIKKSVSGAYEHHVKSVETDTITTEYLRILEEIKGLPYIAQRFRKATVSILSNIWTTALAASGTIIMVFMLFLTIGITVLIALYLMKTFLGINVFADSHMLDFL
ncbi:response regulator [Desulfosediminicola flagellatus]|uniref:response regulator n=1 Tax=Desulfosediminicola flagellatus TaxID=2569541 RepID=UPI0010AB6AB2|nr:response regulator [Desulfosediminicola flagellatus]